MEHADDPCAAVASCSPPAALRSCSADGKPPSEFAIACWCSFCDPLAKAWLMSPPAKLSSSAVMAPRSAATVKANRS
uniref:Uncharacterized protein n=1 Tax=Arundo donax TaxID=35708 RepID=A0A0A9DQC2_ARUDO